MEKYFKITNEKFIEAYEQYERDFDSFLEAFKIMKQEFELDSNEFHACIGRFGIAYNGKDYEKYKDQYKKNDFEFFKKNSDIGKRWAELMKLKAIRYSSEPFCGHFMKNARIGKCTYSTNRLFGELYGYIKTDFCFEPGDGFEEIKASEYYGLIEKYEDEFQSQKEK